MSTFLALVVLAASQEFFGQEGGAPQSEFAGGGLGAKDEAKRFGVTVGARVETWRSLLELDSGNQGVGIPEDDVEFTAAHAAMLLTVAGHYDVTKDLRLGVMLEVGFETVSTRIDVQPPSGPAFADTTQDPALVFGLGLDVGYKFEKVVLGLAIRYRQAATSVDADDTTEVEYDYSLVRFGLNAGYQVTENVQPFLGIRFSKYDSDWVLKTGAPPDTKFTGNFDTEIGMSLGVRLDSGAMTGAFEIQFLDVDLGFAASVGWNF